MLYFHQLLSANLVTIYSRADLGYPWQLAPPPPPNTAGPLSTNLITIYRVPLTHNMIP